jgi:hypothetical protein
MRAPISLACSAVVALAMCAPATARAEEASATPGLHLRWSAPAGCPAGADVAADVARMLPSASSSRRALDADARVSGRGDRWHLTLVTRSAEGRGERELDAPTCRAVADAAALIIALAIDPAAAPVVPSAVPSAPTAAAPVPAAPPGEAPPASASTPAAPSAKSPSASTPAAPSAKSPPAAPAPLTPPTATAARATPRPLATAETPQHARPSAFLVGLSGAGNLGELPSPGGGAELAVGWTPRPLRAEILGDAWLGQSAALASRPGVGGDLRELALGARGCLDFVVAAIDAGPCVGLRVVSMAGSGFGARATFSGSALWAEATAGAFVAARIAGPLALRVVAEGLVPLRRPDFVVLHDGVTESLHRPTALGGKATIGAELRFF